MSSSPSSQCLGHVSGALQGSLPCEMWGAPWAWLGAAGELFLCLQGQQQLQRGQNRMRAASAGTELSLSTNKCPESSPPFLGTHQQPCPDSAGSQQCLAAGSTLSTINNSSCLSCSSRERRHWASAHSAQLWAHSLPKKEWESPSLHGQIG